MKIFLLLIAIALSISINAQTWQKIEVSTSETFNDVFFIGNTGWAVTNDGYVFKTTDKGDTWTSIREDNNFDAIESVWFTSEAIGYIATDHYNYGTTYTHDGKLLKTTDGGVNWSVIYQYDGTIFHNVAFSDDNNGWATCGTKVFKTINAGDNWVEYMTSSTFQFETISIIDQSNIYLSTGSSTSQSPLFNTDNGGDSWNDTGIDVTDDFYGLFFANSTLAWGSSWHGKIYKTTNGSNWELTEIGSTDKFVDIDFTNNLKGIAVGVINGEIWRTENGGTTWEQDVVDDNEGLKRLEYLDEYTAIAVGSDGAIFKFTNGIAPDPLNADFTANQTSGEAPLNVSFSDNSTGGATSWEWDLDNNGTIDATTQNTDFVYTIAGTYTVKLTVRKGTESNTEEKIAYITVNDESSTEDCYLEDFTTDPSFTSLSSTHAYWDQTSGNYIVKTYDDLNDKYWAYSPSFTTFSNLTDINIEFDLLCEQGDFGTYPGVSLFDTEPTEIFNDTRTLRVSFIWSSGLEKRIKIEDFDGHIYISPNSYEENVWYHIKLEYNSSTGKTDFVVTESSSGDVFYQETNVDITLNDFSYLGLGYYDTPNYGNDWSPIKIDNIAICSPTSSVINRVSKETLKIYPNPAQDFITVSLDLDSKDNQVCIYNISGKLLFQQEKLNKTQTIDVSFLEKGIYILQIKNQAYSINKQLIIN